MIKKDRRNFLKLAFMSSLSGIFVSKSVQARSFTSAKNTPISPLKASKNIQDLPIGEGWLAHLKEDLLPFWNMESALGDPIGNFPSMRCNDGSLLDLTNPCSEFKDFSWLLVNRNYVVPLSRQIYTYGVAFHLTGEHKYLEYAKAGIDYLRENAIDRQNGGTYGYRDGENNTWGPGVEFRDPQEQAYGLLGLGFYYYLTRAPEVLSEIISLKNYIFETYDNPKLGTFQWSLKIGENNTVENRVKEKHLQGVLDQLNSYMVLLTPLIPEPHKSQWKRDMLRLSDMMLTQFYSSEENLFFLRAENKSLETTNCDFGHTIKSMWMLRSIGLITGDTKLVNFAEENGKLILERAYLPESGSWALELSKGGDINPDKEWWMYAELDQFAASIVLQDPSVTAYLSQTYNYWLKYFVDREHGEVWSTLDANTNKSKAGSVPKQWIWKNGYHSLEHTLVAYITTQQIENKPIVLYYAFKELPERNNIRPYIYTSKIRTLESLSNDIRKVTFFGNSNEDMN